jgi:hypothetical protein
MSVRPSRVLARILGRKSRPDALAGTWHLERSEDPDSDPGTEIEILANGQMHYSIPAGAKWQIIRLTWWVEDEYLVTDQPSSPHVERTRFAFEPDGKLVLEFGGHRSWFSKGAKRTPAV